MTRNRHDTIADNERAANAATAARRDFSELHDAIMSIIEDPEVPQEMLESRGSIRREWEKRNPNIRMDDLIKVKFSGERMRVPDQVKIAEWLDSHITRILQATREDGQRAVTKIGHWRKTSELPQKVEELVQSDDAGQMTAFVYDIDNEVRADITAAIALFKRADEKMAGREQIASYVRAQYEVALPPLNVQEIVDNKFPNNGFIGGQLRQLRLTEAVDMEGESA